MSSSTSISGPYVNIALYTRVMLYPNQMQNNIYLNLKNNLIKKVKGRCFGNHGFISEVYEILDYKKGKMNAENFTSSAVYSVKFSCRLCCPLPKQQIVCKVDKMNKAFMKLVNGPISIIITNDRINEETFFVDTQRNIRHKHGGTSSKVTTSDHVKITIETVSFSDGSDRIMVIGVLDSMATEDEVKKFFEDQYATQAEDLMEYKEYIQKMEEKLQPLPKVTEKEEPGTVKAEKLGSKPKKETKPKEPKTVKSNATKTTKTSKAKK